MVREFPPFRSERQKRSTSEGTPQFPNGISGKLPYHLTSNRNFRIFSPNGKHPGCHTCEMCNDAELHKMELTSAEKNYLPLFRSSLAIFPSIDCFTFCCSRAQWSVVQTTALKPGCIVIWRSNTAKIQTLPFVHAYHHLLETFKCSIETYKPSLTTFMSGL